MNAPIHDAVEAGDEAEVLRILTANPEAVYLQQGG